MKTSMKGSPCFHEAYDLHGPFGRADETAENQAATVSH